MGVAEGVGGRGVAWGGDGFGGRTQKPKIFAVRPEASLMPIIF